MWRGLHAHACAAAIQPCGRSSVINSSIFRMTIISESKRTTRCIFLNECMEIVRTGMWYVVFDHFKTTRVLKLDSGLKMVPRWSRTATLSTYPRTVPYHQILAQGILQWVEVSRSAWLWCFDGPTRQGRSWRHRRWPSLRVGMQIQLFVRICLGQERRRDRRVWSRA